ncbi:hypothetical protein H8N03_19635 [Ramlibacter sp. USB13]|uniref:Meckel syndrome type 1 protein n=1 Tax=Ramlibacter cellulosilyticus TaxID=2764187 RepID=A0A923MTW2_9BURK|nr:hypothetical protein [Ramlibacter cellulosilyticus]MBC5785168.1 hypothetical protein [Ramlibacter cellulosilyticus]
MTELRDARLRKALDAAPDADLRPHARTRDAIRAAAQGAVQPAWRRWWTRAFAAPMPWAAALATVAVATLVTVTWRGEEPPGAQLDAPVTVQEAPAPAPGPVPAKIPEPAPAPAPAVAPQPAPVPAPSAAPAPERTPVPAAAKAPSTREQRSGAPARDAVAPAAPAAPAETAAAPSPAPAPAAPAPAPAPLPPPLPGPPPAAAIAPAPPAAPQAMRSAPAAGSFDRQAAPLSRVAPPVLPWTQVRIESGGKSVVVARPQAGELPALVTSMLASTSDEAPPGAPGRLRLELAQGDETLGVLDEVAEGWRWTPMREAAPARLLRADPGIAASLRSEAQRLLRR